MIKLSPIKWKYGRTFDVKVKANSASFNIVQYQKIGLICLNNCELFYSQLYSVYKLLKKNFKKKAFIKFNVSLQIPFTKKSVSARMGKGKGPRKGFKAIIKKGTCLIELGNISLSEGILSLNQCSKKLPVKTKIIKFKI